MGGWLYGPGTDFKIYDFSLFRLQLFSYWIYFCLFTLVRWFILLGRWCVLPG